MNSSKNLNAIATAAGDELQTHYVSLESLADKFLVGNSKKHDLGYLAESVDRYSFRDPIAFDSALNGGSGGIIEGNGRLAYLIQAKERGESAPRGIKQSGDEWFVPVLFGVNSASEKEGIAYSISHNLSSIWGSDLEFLDQSSLFDSELLRNQLSAFTDDESFLPTGINENAFDEWMADCGFSLGLQINDTLDKGKASEHPAEREHPVDSSDPLANYKDEPKSFKVVVYCDNKQEQVDLVDELTSQGRKCKILR